jgi:hypothetical protein
MLRKFQKLIYTILPSHAASWKAARAPILSLLQCNNPRRQDELTKVWLEKMDKQLTNISVTVRFTTTPTSGVVTLTYQYVKECAFECNRCDLTCMAVHIGAWW